MAGVPWMTIVGGAMDTAGTAIMGSQAEERRKRFQKVANTPGLDFSALTGNALTGYEQYLPRASALASQVSASNQANLNAQEESALPGVGAARQGALSRINGLFADDAEWLKGVQRRGAALGLSSGLMGSQAGQLQTLRLSDQEQMQRTQLGTGLLGSLVGGLRIANTPGVQTFMGPSMSDQINIRSKERTEKMKMDLGVANLPTELEVWGGRLQEAGSTLAGAGGGFSGTSSYGAGSGGGGGGGGGGNSWSGGGIGSDPYGAVGGWGGT